RRRQRIFNGVTGGAQILNELQRISAEIFIFNQNKNVRVNVEFRQQPARFQKFEQHDVAHAEAERGQIHFAAADEFDEIVVTSTARNRAKFAFGVKRFEDDAGVICE